MPFSIEKKIEKIINEIVRPQLQEHFGDIQLISYENGLAKVSFQGACKGCPSSNTTLENIVKKAIVEKLDVVIDVIAVNPVSHDLISMAKKILGINK